MSDTQLHDLTEVFARLTALQETLPELDDDDLPDAEDVAPIKRGRGRPKGDKPAMTNAERQAKFKQRKREKRQKNIAVLDFETDPFDNESEARIFPFAACLLRPECEPVIIWDEDENSFVQRVIQAIEDLPDSFTVYAHNGGKFDFMFLLHKLRGSVSFKGRGIMAAKIGQHELRDSFHIIPEKLASYRKDDFDYKLLTKKLRNKPKNKAKIIEYMTNDCVYLLDIVSSFVKEHGLKLSIGQAAMAAMKAAGYEVGKLSEGTDAYLRHYFFGGRVECLKGMGVFSGDYKLYDVNSMYPTAMAYYRHPIGKSEEYEVKKPINNKPNENTIFLDLECKNYGALVTRTEDGETSAHFGQGRFKTTIWEYETALKYGLISDVKIHYVVDCARRTDFRNFVLPLYEKRQLTKKVLKRLAEELKTDTREFQEVKKDDIFYKLLLNNAYGKYAQNPRKFKDHYITNMEDRPPPDKDNPWSREPKVENFAFRYAIWERPSARRGFNNVGTAASITGAARAMLMEAIMNAVDPIYCDTDSLICRALNNTELHPDKLGAWDLEDEFTEVVIAGKKLYGCKKKDGKTKLRSKGTAGISYDDMVSLISGNVVSIKSKGPTINKMGLQSYITRDVRATAKPGNELLLAKILERNVA